VITATYVGSESHHLLTLVEANPGNPALCSASAIEPVAPDRPLRPLWRIKRLYTAAGKVITHASGTWPELRQRRLADYIGNSNYNACNSVPHVSRGLELHAGYTYGKSLDNSSSISEQLNPITIARLCAFCLRP